MLLPVHTTPVKVPLFGKKHPEQPQTTYQPLIEEKPLNFPLNPRPAQGHISLRAQYFRLRILAALRTVPVLESKIPVPFLGDGKAVLDKLAATDRYCFHGKKGTIIIRELVPNKPDYKVTLDTGEKRFHSEVPKIWLSPFPLVAIFNATLRDKIAGGWRTFLDQESKNAFIIPDATTGYIQSVLNSELQKGIVYLFDKKNPDIESDPFISTELCSTQKLKPIGYVTVSLNDLPFDIRELPKTANPFDPKYSEDEIRRFFKTVGYSNQEIERLWPILEKNTKYRASKKLEPIS